MLILRSAMQNILLNIIYFKTEAKGLNPKGSKEEYSLEIDLLA